MKTGSESSLSEEAVMTKHILVAEDSLMIQQVILALLSPLSLTIDVASNGREAIKALSRERYDLVFMDCQMPEMDGYEATRILRNHEIASGASRTPVVALTGNATQEDREKCLEVGMDDYVPKPFHREELISILRKWLHITDSYPKKGKEHPTQTEGQMVSTGDNGNGVAAQPVMTDNRDKQEERGPVISTSVLDGIRSLQRPGEPDLVGKLTKIYMLDTSKTMKTLSLAIREKNTQDIFRLAHKLKSSSANVGALHLSALLKDLEFRGRQNEIEGAEDIFVHIEKEYDDVQRALKTFMP